MNPAAPVTRVLREKFPADGGGIRLFVNADCALHDPGRGHAEAPGRLLACLRGLTTLPAATPLALIEPGHAGWSALRIAHDCGYLLALESAIHSGRPHFMHPECPLDHGSGDAILAAAGLALALGGSLAEGVSGFALTRPPGHHAGPARAEGFCFLNHAALAAARLRERRPGARVAVVDLDLHYGNGTRDHLKDIPDTFLLSLHGEPSALMYPHGGFISENQDAPAVVRNRPLPAGCAPDAWLAALDAGLAEVAAFRPDAILVGLGLDGHAEDPFGFFRLDDAAFVAALDRICDLAQAASGRPAPVGLLLEGGYSEPVLERLIPRLVARFAERMRP